MKKLRIGFDAKRLFENDTGLGNYSRHLLLSLKKYYPQHEYHLFAPKIVRKTATEPFLNGDFILHTNEGLMPNSIWRSMLQSKAINDLNLDIYHGLSHELPSGIKKDIKTVVTIHDLIYEILPHTFGWINSRIYQWKYRKSVKIADKVVAITESTKQDIIKYYQTDAQKISVIYQSCNEVFHHEVAAQSKEYYLYVGTVNERKNSPICHKSLQSFT